MTPPRAPEPSSDDIVVFDEHDDDIILLPGLRADNASALGPPGSSESQSTRCWTVLVVDDDQDVFEVTKLALRRFEVDGVPLRLLHASSGAEARAILADEPDCVLVLLDVVMETEEEGLNLIRWTRSSLENHQVRMIVRTGQPGRAIEAAVATNIDIHDYLPKTGTSAARLRGAVTDGVRAWRQLASRV
jgi:CheY-like chemotaxis protein